MSYQSVGNALSKDYLPPFALYGQDNVHGWTQVSKGNLKFSSESVEISRENFQRIYYAEFGEVPIASSQCPNFSGKMWKTMINGVWHLCVLGDTGISSDNSTLNMQIHTYAIKIKKNTLQLINSGISLIDEVEKYLRERGLADDEKLVINNLGEIKLTLNKFGLLYVEYTLEKPLVSHASLYKSTGLFSDILANIYRTSNDELIANINHFKVYADRFESFIDYLKKLKKEK